MRLRNHVLVASVAAVALAAAAVGNSRAQDDAPTLDERVARLEAELAVARQGEAARRGARVFARACAACHGSAGRGDGPAAADLDPPPRDLTARQFRFRTTPSGEQPRPEDLERTIRKGLPGSLMPGFGRLIADDEMSDLIAFVYSVRPETAGTWAPADPIVLAPVPPATAETIEKGRALYLMLGCGSCHGNRGDGKGPSAAGLTDENDRPMGTTDFLYDPLKGGRSAEAIVRALRTGLNGAPMPSYDDAVLFAREQIDPAAVPGGLDADERAAFEALARVAPTLAELQRLDDGGRSELRDRRLAAVAHYVLSLERRRGFRFWLFRQEPEREPRPERAPKRAKAASDEEFWE